MNILFITLVGISDIHERGIYTDLVRHFLDNGHQMTVISPLERREINTKNKNNYQGLEILRFKSLNFQKTTYLEKFISTLSMDFLLRHSIKTNLRNQHIDLVIYTTPPITLTKTITYVKQYHKAKTYLLLKDIFPNNIVDLGVLSKKSFLYKIFKAVETKLYNLSDYIGCMSPANVDYILHHNNISASKVEVCPNSIQPLNKDKISKEYKDFLKKKYNINPDARIFFYGGNLGIPQMIHFIIDVLNSNTSKNSHFFIIGGGTDFPKLDSWYRSKNPKNVTLLNQVTKLEFDDLIKIADVGLIFLDNRYTIPNYPSRLLSYLENKIPILAATDINTDLGRIAETNNYGKWCKSGDTTEFNKLIDYFVQLNKEDFTQMGLNGHSFLVNNYTVKHSYNTIIKHFNN